MPSDRPREGGATGWGQTGWGSGGGGSSGGVTSGGSVTSPAKKTETQTTLFSTSDLEEHTISRRVSEGLPPPPEQQPSGYKITPPAPGTATREGEGYTETITFLNSGAIIVEKKEKVPIGYFGEIKKPETLEESYKSDVFPVSYPGISPALNLYTIKLTGWGDTPAGKKFIEEAYGTKTTITTYTPSNVIDTMKLKTSPVSYSPTAHPDFREFLSKFKEVPTAPDTYEHQGQLYSVDTSKGIPKGYAPVHKILQYQENTPQIPTLNVNFGEGIQREIGTKRNVDLALKEIENKLPPPSERPVLTAQKVFEEPLSEKERRALLSTPSATIYSALSNLVVGGFYLTGIPIALEVAQFGKSIIEQGTDALYWKAEEIKGGVNKFVTKTIRFEWTPAEAAGVGGAIVGGMIVSSIMTNLLQTKILPKITEIRTRTTTVGYVAETFEYQGTQGYMIEAQSAGEIATRLKFIGTEIHVKKFTSEATFVGTFIPEEAGLKGVEVIGATTGKAIIGGQEKTFFSLGLIGKSKYYMKGFSPEGITYFPTKSITNIEIFPSISLTKMGTSEVHTIGASLKILETDVSTSYFSTSVSRGMQMPRIFGKELITIFSEKPIPHIDIGQIQSVTAMHVAKTTQTTPITLAKTITAPLFATSIPITTARITSELPTTQIKLLPETKPLTSTTSIQTTKTKITPIIQPTETSIPRTSTTVRTTTVTKIMPLTPIQSPPTVPAISQLTQTTTRTTTRITPQTTITPPTKLIQPTITSQLTRTTTRTIPLIPKPTVPTITTPTFPPVILPPPPQSSSSEAVIRNIIPRQMPRKSLTYTPSLTAIVFNIKKPRMNKKIFSGLEIRPIRLKVR